MNDDARTCTACGVALSSSLDTFGDYDAPMCSDCHFALLNEPLAQAFFAYIPVGNGYYEQRLTEAGAIFLEGTPGELMMIVQRPAHV
jgi:hypothetical protein